MKKGYLFFQFFSLTLLFFSFSQITLQAQEKLEEVWRKTVKGVISYDFVTAPFITMDKQENIYVAGAFEKTVKFGDKTLTSKGSWDIFVLKYNKEGEMLWLTQLGNQNKEQLGNLRLLDNKIFVFANTVDTTYSENAKTLSHGYIICLDLKGKEVWTRYEKETHSTFPKIDQAGKMYITHSFKGKVKLNETRVLEEKSRYPNSFLAKYDSSSQLTWSFLLDETPHIYRTGEVNAAGLTVDKNGDIYVGGTFRKTPFFKKTQIKSGKGDDVFLAKYTPDGELAWILQLTHTSEEYNVHKIYINHLGNVCIRASSLDPKSEAILPVLHTYLYAPAGSSSKSSQRYTWTRGEKLTNDLIAYDYSDWVLSPNKTAFYKVGVTANKMYIVKFSSSNKDEKQENEN